jgi:hypothetical protein
VRIVLFAIQKYSQRKRKLGYRENDTLYGSLAAQASNTYNAVWYVSLHLFDRAWGPSLTTDVLFTLSWSAEQTFAIVRMRSFLNYSEHCRLEASAREQSRVLGLLNRPQVWPVDRGYLLLQGILSHLWCINPIILFVFPTGLMALIIIRGITHFISAWIAQWFDHPTQGTQFDSRFVHIFFSPLLH